MTVLQASGYIKPVTVIALTIIEDDGSVKCHHVNMDYSSTYEFQVLNSVSGMLYTVRGVLKHSMVDPSNTNANRGSIDYLIIDESKENESKLTRICIEDIRSINKIENFE